MSKKSRLRKQAAVERLKESQSKEVKIKPEPVREVREQIRVAIEPSVAPTYIMSNYVNKRDMAWHKNGEYDKSMTSIINCCTARRLYGCIPTNNVVTIQQDGMVQRYNVSNSIETTKYSLYGGDEDTEQLYY